MKGVPGSAYEGTYVVRVEKIEKEKEKEKKRKEKFTREEGRVGGEGEKVDFVS